MNIVKNVNELNEAVINFEGPFLVTIEASGTKRDVVVTGTMPPYPNCAYAQIITNEGEIIGYNIESENPQAAFAITEDQINEEFGDDLADGLEYCEASKLNDVSMGYIFGDDKYKVTLFAR